MGGLDSRTPGNTGLDPDRVSAGVTAITPDQARQEVEKFPWVSQIPRFSYVGDVFIDDITSPFGGHNIPQMDLLFWAEIERVVGRERRGVINDALIGAGTIVGGVEKDLKKYPHSGWAEVHTAVYEVQEAIASGEIKLRTGVALEQYAILIRLFGPNYDRSEPSVRLVPPARSGW